MPPQDQKKPQDETTELDRLRAEAFRAQQATIKAMQEQNQQQAQAATGGRQLAPGLEVVKFIPSTGGSVVRDTATGNMKYEEPGGAYYTTNRAEIERILQGEEPGQARRTETQKQILEQSGGQAAALSAVKGIPFVGEYLDEAIGAVTGDPRQTAAAREMATAYQEQKPVEAFGGQAALGAVATLPFIPFQAAGRAIQAAPTLLQGMFKVGGAGAVAGGTEGAISGFGAGEGTAEQRIPSAQSGAGFGALFGGVLGAASEPLRFGIENVTKYFSNAPVRQLAKDFGVSEEAARMIRLFIKDGDIESARTALARAGSKSMLAEVSPGTKRLLDAAIELGSGSQAPLDAIELRVATSNKELDDGLNRFFGGAPRDVTDMKTDIVQATAEARQQAYDAAYASPINYNSTGGQNLLNQSQNLTPDIIAEANLLIQTDPYLRTKPPPMKFESPAAAGAAVPDVAALKQQGFDVDTKLYHGTAADFETFDASKLGANDPLARDAKEAFFFTTSPEIATQYADEAARVAAQRKVYATPEGRAQLKNPTREGAERVGKMIEAEIKGAKAVPVNFRLRNPKIITTIKEYDPDTDEVANAIAQAKAEGHDGVIFKGMSDALRGNKIVADTYAIFDPANIVRADRPTSAAAQPGRAEFETPPTVMQWDYIARALQDRAKRERREVGTSKKGANYEGTLNNIRSELKTQIPVYRDALGIAGDTFAEQEAMDLGERLLQKNTTVGEITRFVKTAEKPQIEALKKGIRADIESEIKSVKTSALNPNTDPKELSAALSLLRIPNNMTKMRAILGQQEFDDFYKLLDEQATSIELMGAVARNSKTAGRQDIKQTAEQVLFGGGILSQIGRGKVVNTQEVLVQSMTGLTPEADAARRMGLFDDVASVLTRMQGQEAKDALEMIERARKGRVLSDGQARIIAKAMTRPAAMALYAPLTAGQREKQSQQTRPYQSGMGRPE